MMGQKPLAAEECNHQWTPYCEGERCARCGLTVGARFYSKDGGWYTGNVSNAARAEDHTSLPRLVAGRIAMIDDDAENWIGEATRIIAEAFPAPAADRNAARENVAKAIYFEMNSIMHDHEKLWAECGKQDIYRDCARAALLTMPAAKPAPVGVEEIVRMLEKFARPGLFSEMAYDGDTNFIEIFGGEWRAARALLARLKDAPVAVSVEEIAEASEHLDFLSGLTGVHPHRIARLRTLLARLKDTSNV